MLPSGLKKPTRPWWQVICRAGAAIVVLVVAAYVTLPLWLPGSLISDSLAAEMSRQVGSPVKIESLSASWADGLYIENMSVAMPAGFGGGQMLTIERIEVDFSPLKLLFANRIEWMNIDGINVEVRFDNQGRTNIAYLGSLENGTLTERIGIRDGLVSVWLPDEAEPIRLNLTDVRYLATDPSRPGRLTAIADIQQGKMLAPITLRFTPAVSSSGLLATAAISVSGLDLGEFDWSEKFAGPLSQLNGLCSGSIELELDESLVVDRFTLDVDVEAPAGASLAGPGMPLIPTAGVTADGTIDLLSQRVTIENFNLSLPGVELAGKVSASLQPGPRLDELAATYEIRQWDIFDELGVDLGSEVEISGPISGKVTVDNTGQTRIRVTVSAGKETAISIGHFVKPAGKQLDAAFAGTVDSDSMSINDLYLELSAEDWKFTLDQASLGMAWDGTELGIDSHGQIELTDLTAALSCIDGVPDGAAQLSGQLSGSYDIQASTSSSEIKLDLDLKGLGVCLDDMVLKQPGSEGEVKLLFARQGSGSENRVDRFACYIKTPRYAAAVNGLTGDVGSWPWREGKLSGSVQFTESSSQPDDGLELMLDHYGLAGRVDYKVDIANGRGQIDLDLTELAGEIDGREIKLDGKLRSGGPWFEGVDTMPKLSDLDCQLRFQVGPSEGWVVANLANLPDQADGQVHLLLDNLDGRDLADWIAGPALENLPLKLSAAEIANLDARADSLIADLRKYLTSADLAVEINAKKAAVFDKSVGQGYDLNDVHCKFSARDGRIDFSNISGLNGGTMSSEISFDLTEPDPQVTCYQSMSNLVATPSLRPQLAKFFPGNTVEGLFNRREETTAALGPYLAKLMEWRYPLHPVGTAETLAIGGYVEGSGAPDFVTAVFPELNLTKYRYEKMTSFAEFRADGSADNDMIFDGDSYNIYMEGKTDPDNYGEYEIGLLLASKNPHWQHRWRQGRIPVLKFTGIIEGGKIHDQKMSYFWPNQSLFIMFLKNNIFYRMWLNGRQD